MIAIPSCISADSWGRDSGGTRPRAIASRIVAGQKADTIQKKREEVGRFACHDDLRIRFLSRDVQMRSAAPGF